MTVATGFASDVLTSFVCATMHLVATLAMVNAPTKPIIRTADCPNAQHRSGGFKGFTIACIMGKLPNPDKNKRTVGTTHLHDHSEQRYSDSREGGATESGGQRSSQF
jgi:hypothetical protein